MDAEICNLGLMRIRDLVLKEMPKMGNGCSIGGVLNQDLVQDTFHGAQDKFLEAVQLKELLWSYVPWVE